ncbi:MAG: hypothetical protein IPI01_05405 [Ignavibacteriae bacterium]|nr:hypothetical protein [Ignavibacteriota bacterium]
MILRKHGLLLLLAVTVAGSALAGETIYMSVLSSRKHAWGKNDFPVIGLFVSTDAGRSWVHRGWREYIRMFYTEAGPDGVLWSACGNGVLRSKDDGATWRVTTGSDVTEVLRLSVDRRDARRIAAATAYGPILSVDGGDRWQFIDQGLPTRFTGDIIIDRSQGALLVATEKGIFKRAATGTRWRPTTMTKDTRTIVQHSTEPRIFYAGTEEDGVWRSDDGGQTWKAHNVGLAHKTVYALATAPGVSGAVYAATFGGGVYRSDDGGKSWHQKSKGLTILDCHAVQVLPSSPTTVLAGTLNGGLFISTDAGETWVFNGQADAQVWGLCVRN